MPKSPKPHRRRAARIAASAQDRNPAASAPDPAFTPVPLRTRADGWTPERQLRFIEALAESGCVEEACRFVGKSKQSAYRLRMRPEAQAFRLAWDAAIDLAIRVLSDACLGRAIHGIEVPHYFQGELIGTHRRYDNRLAQFLLRYRDPLRYAATLDHMVYAGHPEGAALRYKTALENIGETAPVFDDDIPTEDPDDREQPFPWTVTAMVDARQRAADEELAASDGPVHGSFERQERIRRLRAEKRRERARAPGYRERFEEARARYRRGTDIGLLCSYDHLPAEGDEPALWDYLFEEERVREWEEQERLLATAKARDAARDAEAAKAAEEVAAAAAAANAAAWERAAAEAASGARPETAPAPAPEPAAPPADRAGESAMPPDRASTPSPSVTAASPPDPSIRRVILPPQQPNGFTHPGRYSFYDEPWRFSRGG